MQSQGTVKTTYPNNKEYWRYIEVYRTDFRDELIMMVNTVVKLNLWNWCKTESHLPIRIILIRSGGTKMSI